MKKVITIFTLLQFACFGYAADPTRESQIDNILEAVFRYQFDHVSTNELDAKVYVLGIGESCSDPSDEFLKRFAGRQPTVKKASDWVRDWGRIDKEPGEKALMFCANRFVCISDTIVEVSASHHRARVVGGGGNFFPVKGDDAKGRVT